MNYPRTKKQKPHHAVPYSHCKKFKENPQKYFGEPLCANVLKALDLKKNKRVVKGRTKSQPNVNLSASTCKRKSNEQPKEQNKKNKLKLIKIERKPKAKKVEKEQTTMYNIKKYFEETYIDKDDGNLSD